MSSTEAESSSPCTVILKNDHADRSSLNSPSSTGSGNFTSNNANSVVTSDTEVTPVGPQPEGLLNPAPTSRPTSYVRPTSCGSRPVSRIAEEDGVTANDADKSSAECKHLMSDGAATNTDIEVGDDDDEKERGKFREFCSKKEVLLCSIGLITFAIGLILLVASMMLWRQGCRWKENKTKMPSILGGSASEDNNHFPLYKHYLSDYYNDYDENDANNNQTRSNSTTNSTSDFDSANGNVKEELNLALNKQTRQSSTVTSNGTMYQASLAVDGNATPRFSRMTCSQTDWEAQPWWSVDLGIPRLVRRLKLTIPKDCCAADMHNFVVRIGQDDDNPFNNNLCQYHQGTALTDTIDLLCRRQLYGRYLRIIMLGDRVRPRNRLTLCEVEVFRQ